MSTPFDSSFLKKRKPEITASDAFGVAKSDIEFRLQEAIQNFDHPIIPIVYFIPPNDLLKFFETAEAKWPPNEINTNDRGEFTYIFKAVDNFIRTRGGDSNHRMIMTEVIYANINELELKIKEIKARKESLADEINKIKNSGLDQETINQEISKINQPEIKNRSLIVFKSESRNNTVNFYIYETPQESFEETAEFQYSQNSFNI